MEMIEQMGVLVCGASGRMGKELVSLIKAGQHTVLAAAVDRALPVIEGIPCYTALEDVQEWDAIDVIIDFSHHSATDSLLSCALAHGVPVVIATTGQTEAERARIAEAAQSLPVFFSGNMSLGIALLVSLAKQAAATFPDADIEIVEVHHNQKQDVPSGTALMIANGIREARGGDAPFCVGRHENGKRTPGEIGIHSLRLGRVVGEHEVRIDTGTQTIVLRHEAHSRNLFAEGAVSAAAFLMGQPNGLYQLSDLFK